MTGGASWVGSQLTGGEGGGEMRKLCSLSGGSRDREPRMIACVKRVGGRGGRGEGRGAGGGGGGGGRGKRK